MPLQVEQAKPKIRSASAPREFSPAAKAAPRWARYLYGVVASEISATTRYYDHVIQLAPLEHDRGILLEHVECKNKSTVANIKDIPEEHEQVPAEHRTAIMLNGNFNYDLHIQGTLSALKPRLSRSSRLVVLLYNPYLSWLYSFITWLGVRKGAQPTTFLTTTSLRSICRLAGYEVVRTRNVGYSPYWLLGLGGLMNRLLPLIPLVRWLGLLNVVVLRPVMEDQTPPSLTVVIPARNEKGNIENALKRMPRLPGVEIEVIFVEGNSTDGTWEEIQRVLPLYQDEFRLSAYKQPGKGKNDAVRVGFQNASGDLLTILDADLTMPPERLGDFYEAYRTGLGDFINGNRLVYPMEGEAMRFLNTLGNVFFAKALSFVLSAPIGDSLCGTKLVARHDYERIVAWRGDFGDFDPFGDFELLFSSSELALDIVDIPIRYAARTYGSTNIRRFRDGLLLLRMTLVGLFFLRMGKVK